MPAVVEAFLWLGSLTFIANVVYALKVRRIAWGHMRSEVQWAQRDERPVLFWTMVVMNAVIGASLIWLALGSKP